MSAPARLFAVCLALAVVVNGWWCVCGRAMTVAYSTATPCCGVEPGLSADVDESRSSHEPSSHACPQCEHAHPTATVAKSMPTAFPPTAPSAFALPLPSPTRRMTAVAASVVDCTAAARSVPLPLRLHCAFCL